MKHDEEREQRRRRTQDEREERELARQNPDRSLGDDLLWHGLAGLILNPFRALMKLFFSEVDRRRKK